MNIEIEESKKSNYKELKDFIKPKDNEENSDYVKTMLKKVQTMSLFIRKFKLIEDQEYIMTKNKPYSKLINKTAQKIKDIITKMMMITGRVNKLDDVPDILDNFDALTDFVDDLVEKISDNLDIMKGLKKDKKNEDIEQELKKLQEKNSELITLKANRQNYIPMDDFDCDNSYFPFIPKIKTKPNSIEEMNSEILAAWNERQLNKEKYLQINFKDKRVSYRDPNLFSHPYRMEIETLVQDVQKRIHSVNDSLQKFVVQKGKEKYLNKQAVVAAKVDDDDILTEKIRRSEYVKKHSIADFQPDQFNSLNKFHNYIFNNENEDPELITDETKLKEILELNEYEYTEITNFKNSEKFLYVDTLENFEIMISELKLVQEIAVDLEHHSQESYLGFLCLMQISTRFRDYIVDVIALRKHIADINVVFTDPNILKVLHGADFDVIWLQKDFGVYIINMFDTGQAARVLGLPSFSLAFLLKDFCNINADKQYQLADWRLRPLSKEMIKYAREDTHYLLTIYDKLKTKLIQRSAYKGESVLTLYLTTYTRSNELTIKQYYKPNVKSNSNYYPLVERNATLCSNRQLSILKILLKFRDYVGRKTDKNANNVLGNSAMFKIVKVPLVKLENLYEIVEKKEMRSFIPELWALIEEKMQRIELKEKNNKVVNKEQDYINSVKGLSSFSNIGKKKTTETHEKENKKENVVYDSDYTFENLKKLNNDVDITLKQKNGGDINFLHKNEIISSSSESDCSSNQDNKGDASINNAYNEVMQKFSQFSLVKFLKDKHNLKLDVKSTSSTDKNITEKKVQKEEENIMTKTLPKSMDEKLGITEDRLTKKKRQRETVDMTQIKDINGNKKHQVNEEDESDDSAEEIDVSHNKSKNKVKPDMNFGKIANQSYMKNLKASSEFITKILKK